MRLLISMAATAASDPLLPALVPARSIACSMVSHVSTPKMHGTPVSNEATATPSRDEGGVHGNDERVTVENVRRGVEMTLRILERFAATRPVMEED